MSPSTTRRVRIVFAFVDTGMGHRAPALAVREHLERTRPNRFDVVLVDLLAELGLAGLDRFAKAVWSKWLLRHPLLIDSAYWTGHVYSAVLLPAMAFFLAPQFHRLERYCRRLHADLLVTTHILSTNPLAILRERGRLGSPVAGMVVDPFDKYRISGHAGLDALITFSHRSMAAYRAMYPTVDVVRFGFPLSARFDSRPAPRLRTPTFTLLMTAGAEGGARLCEYVERILAASLGIRIVVVCGRDGSLRRRLRSLVHGSTPDAGSRPECAVLGFVDNMDELISSCELFVGTGGANLTMEALSLGRPTILTL